MRKLLITTALLLFAGLAFGQTIQKGNLIGLHVLSVELKSGVTMEQYIDAFNKNSKSAWEKADKEMKVFLVKGLRGERMNEIGMIVHFKDEAARDKYYDSDGNQSEIGNKIFEAVAPVTAELEKLGTYTSKYTDWLVL